MNISLKHIILGEGLGELFFGMSRADIRRKLGDPSEIEIYEYIPDSGEMAETWHYDDDEISLTFYEEDADWQLETIAVSSDRYSMEGEHLVGMRKNDAIQLLKEMDLGPCEESAQEDGQIILNLVNQNMILWVEDDEVSEIQWEPIWHDD